MIKIKILQPYLNGRKNVNFDVDVDNDIPDIPIGKICILSHDTWNWVLGTESDLTQTAIWKTTGCETIGHRCPIHPTSKLSATMENCFGLIVEKHRCVQCVDSGVMSNLSATSFKVIDVKCIEKEWMN